MNFIYNIPKAYPKKSCNKLIDWFEANINIAAYQNLDDLNIPKTFDQCNF